MRRVACCVRDASVCVCAWLRACSCAMFLLVCLRENRAMCACVCVCVVVWLCVCVCFVCVLCVCVCVCVCALHADTSRLACVRAGTRFLCCMCACVLVRGGGAAHVPVCGLVCLCACACGWAGTRAQRCVRCWHACAPRSRPLSLDADEASACPPAPRVARPAAVALVTALRARGTHAALSTLLAAGAIAALDTDGEAAPTAAAAAGAAPQPVMVRLAPEAAPDGGDGDCVGDGEAVVACDFLLPERVRPVLLGWSEGRKCVVRGARRVAVV